MKSQKDIIKDALLRGETLDQLSMLFDYGVGNHTAIMTLVRRDFQGTEFFVVTEWRKARSRKTGREVRYAIYYIPSRVRKPSLWERIKQARRR